MRIHENDLEDQTTHQTQLFNYHSQQVNHAISNKPILLALIIIAIKTHNLLDEVWPTWP